MGQALDRDDLITIKAADILSSRVFLGEVEGKIQLCLLDQVNEFNPLGIRDPGESVPADRRALCSG